MTGSFRFACGLPIAVALAGRRRGGVLLVATVRVLQPRRSLNRHAAATHLGDDEQHTAPEAEPATVVTNPTNPSSRTHAAAATMNGEPLGFRVRRQTFICGTVLRGGPFRCVDLRVLVRARTWLGAHLQGCRRLSVENTAGGAAPPPTSVGGRPTRSDVELRGVGAGDGRIGGDGADRCYRRGSQRAACRRLVALPDGTACGLGSTVEDPSPLRAPFTSRRAVTSHRRYVGPGSSHGVPGTAYLDSP